ncbi:MAG: hypothetical protein Q8N30_00570 [Methylococcales bacterium]|nr:hypothetical protein [Methylococcales bacterium]
MKKMTHTYYLPMLLEGLVSWWRIGEILIYQDQLWAIQAEKNLPLNEESSLDKLKNILPRFENIRNFVVVEIKKPEFQPVNAFSTCITYDEVIAIYTLDANPASQRYIQSLVPSIKIEQQSILDEGLSNRLINWSAKRNAELGAKKLLSLPNIKNDDSVSNSISWENMLEACFLNEIPKDSEKITRFFYTLFSFSRKSITCKYNFVDLGFIDDIKNILKIAIDDDISIGLTLSSKDDLSQLIKKISENKEKIQKFKEYCEGDFFIPALIFLKLKQLHEKPINAEIFYNFVNELNAVGCDRDLISVGISWYGAYFGYIEIRELYLEAKKYSPPIPDVIPEPPEATENTLPDEEPIQDYLLDDSKGDKSIFFSGKTSSGKENNLFYDVVKAGKFEIKDEEGKKNGFYTMK